MDRSAESRPDTPSGPVAEDGFAAFISYRHAHPDREWADWLHAAIEGYRVPKALRVIGAARVGRVFQDEKELSASHDLAQEIREALDASQFLIAICSPRAPASTYICEELAYFQRIGRGDRILPLLIEGEPGEAFPPQLVRTGPEGARLEPLAADGRPRDGESQRSIRRTALLRLMAPILGCEFDALRQRDHERQRRRLLLGALSLGILLLVFVGLSFWAISERDRADLEARSADNAREDERRAKERALENLGRAYLAQAPHEPSPFRRLLFAAKSTELLGTPEARGALVEAMATLPVEPLWSVAPGNYHELRVAWDEPSGQFMTIGGSRTGLIWSWATQSAIRRVSDPLGNLVHVVNDTLRGEWVYIGRSGIVRRVGRGLRRVPGAPIRLGLRGLRTCEVEPETGTLIAVSGAKLFKTSWFGDTPPELIASDLGPEARIGLSSHAAFVVACDKRRIRLWSLESGALLSEAVLPGRTLALSIQSTGSHVAVATEQGVLRFPVSGELGEPASLRTEMAGAVAVLAFAGNDLVAIGRDGGVSLWGEGERQARAIGRLDVENVTHGSVSADGRRAVLLLGGASMATCELDPPSVLGVLDGAENPWRAGYGLAIPQHEDWLVSCPQQGWTCVRSPQDGRAEEVLGTPHHKREMPYALEIIESPTRIAIAGSGGQVALMTPGSNEAAYFGKRAHADARDLLYLPRRHLLAVGHGKGGVRLWSCGSGELVAHFKEIEGQALYLAASVDESQLAVGTNGGRVYVYSMSGEGDAPPSFRLLRMHRLDGDVPVQALRYRGELLEIYASVNQVTLLNATTGDVTDGGTVELSGVSTVATDLPRGLMAVAGMDGFIEIRESSSFALRGRFRAHEQQVQHLAFGPKTGHLYSVALHGSLRCWRIRRRAQVASGIGSGLGAQTSLVQLPKSGSILTTGMPGKFLIRDARSGNQIRSFKAHAKGIVISLAVSPDATEVLSLDTSGTLKRWSLPEFEEAKVTGIAKGPKFHAVYSPDGTFIALGHGNGHVSVYDLSGGRPRWNVPVHAGAVSRVAVLPGGDRLLSASRDYVLTLLDAQDGKIVHRFRGHGAGLISLAVHPDGRRAAVGLQSGPIWIWNLETGEREGVLTGHKSIVTMLRYHPHGEHLFSTSLDGTLRLWHVESEMSLATTRVHATGAGPLSLSADGGEVLVGSLRGAGLFRYLFDSVSRPQSSALEDAEALLRRRLVGVESEPIPSHRFEARPVRGGD